MKPRSFETGRGNRAEEKRERSVHDLEGERMRDIEK
jgi:hypothetical protein